MKKISLVLLLTVSQFVLAQQFVNQVLILNEGRYDYATSQIDVPVTIGSYNPTTQSYAVLDTIEGARFASDLITHEDYLYVVADSQLLKYSLDTYEVEASQNVVGGRNLLVEGQNIYVTRGEYGINLDSYLQVFDKDDLSLVAELDTINGPKFPTQNMVFDDGKLFIAINNGFVWGSETSLIGVLDLSTFSYLEEIDLGPDGTNPDNMMKHGEFIYTINNKNWSGASISKVDLNTYAVNTINLSDVSTGCGTSCLRGDKLNFQLLQDSVLYEYDPETFSGSGTSIAVNGNFYELAFDTLNNLLYSSVTDYQTYGKIKIFDVNNDLISEFDCGVSPGTIAFDIRNSSSILDLHRDINESNLLFDLNGKPIRDFQNQPKGIYIKSGKKIFNN